MTVHHIESGQVIWLMGLSGSGKSTLADAMAQNLEQKGINKVYRLDGDTLRSSLNSNLGFSQQDRDENLRRAAHVAKLLVDEGYTVIASFITPLASQRQMIKALFAEDQYREVYLSASLTICEQRDPKGLYRKARQGLIPEFTGIGSAYEQPDNPSLIINTANHSIQDCLDTLVRELSL